VIYIYLLIIIVIILVIYFYYKNKNSNNNSDENKAVKIRINAMANKKVTVENIIKINNSEYQFDVYIEATGLQLTSYQVALNFNQKIIKNGILTLEYILGTCELNNPPAYGLGINDADGIKKLTFASGPGGEIVLGKKRIGKFKLTNSLNFPSNEDIDLSWSFNGFINTIFLGENYNDITSELLFSIIKGDINMITINENQKVKLTANPVTAKGNPAVIDGPVTWQVVSGSNFITLTPVDNFSVYAVAVGPVGVATIKASADSDLGTPVSIISNTITVEVVAGPAATLNIIAGNPEQQ